MQHHQLDVDWQLVEPALVPIRAQRIRANTDVTPARFEQVEQKLVVVEQAAIIKRFIR